MSGSQRAGRIHAFLRALQVIINYNIDLGDYVEWSADMSNAYSLVPTNEAYKFLINYVLYGLTR